VVVFRLRPSDGHSQNAGEGIAGAPTGPLEPDPRQTRSAVESSAGGGVEVAMPVSQCPQFTVAPVVAETRLPTSTTSSVRLPLEIQEAREDLAPRGLGAVGMAGVTGVSRPAPVQSQPLASVTGECLKVGP